MLIHVRKLMPTHWCLKTWGRRSWVQNPVTLDLSHEIVIEAYLCDHLAAEFVHLNEWCINFKVFYTWQRHSELTLLNYTGTLTCQAGARVRLARVFEGKGRLGKGLKFSTSYLGDTWHAVSGNSAKKCYTVVAKRDPLAGLAVFGWAVDVAALVGWNHATFKDKEDIWAQFQVSTTHSIRDKLEHKGAIYAREFTESKRWDDEQIPKTIQTIHPCIPERGDNRRWTTL